MNALIHDSNETVTVIIAMYNGSKSIESTIESVLSQTYENIFIIICDDASTDDSVNKILSLNSNKIKLLENNKNLGLSKTRKKLISLVNTKWLAFIDQDDTWNQQKIEKQINLLKKENCSMSHSNYIVKMELTGLEKMVKSKPKIFYKDLLGGHCPGASTVVINTDYFTNLSSFCDDRKLDSINDYVMWLNFLSGSNNYSICLQETMMVYSFHGNNLSLNKFKQLTKHFYILKNIEKIHFLNLIYYVCKNIIIKAKYYIT